MSNIVLVHGAWSEGSIWSKVIKLLHSAGHHVIAPQLSQTSLGDNVSRIREVLANQHGSTLIAGHSYGGAVISALGTDAPNVVGLAYISAFGIDEGESLNSLLAKGPLPAYLAEIIPDSKGHLYLSEYGFLKYFASDIDPVSARVMYAVQQAPLASIFDEKMGTPAWKTIPSWYLITTEDQIITPTTQTFLAQRMGATIQTVVSGHVSMLSHPEDVAEFILSAAGQA